MLSKARLSRFRLWIGGSSRPLLLLHPYLITHFAHVHCDTNGSPIIMNFQFVANDAIDDASRKKIRSHVMRGKNTGRRPPVQKDRAKLALRPIEKKVTIQAATKSKCKSEENALAMSKPLGNELGYFTFPVELNASMAWLIRRCKCVRRVFHHSVL